MRYAILFWVAMLAVMTDANAQAYALESALMFSTKGGTISSKTPMLQVSGYLEIEDKKYRQANKACLYHHGCAAVHAHGQVHVSSDGTFLLTGNDHMVYIDATGDRLQMYSQFGSGVEITTWRELSTLEQKAGLHHTYILSVRQEGELLGELGLLISECIGKLMAEHEPEGHPEIEVEPEGESNWKEKLKPFVEGDLVGKQL